jgi:hypothetical protein
LGGTRPCAQQKITAKKGFCRVGTQKTNGWAVQAAKLVSGEQSVGIGKLGRGKDKIAQITF